MLALRAGCATQVETFDELLSIFILGG